MATTAPAQKEDRVVFSLGPKNFSVRDVIDAAHFRGEIESAWQQLLARLEAEREAGEEGAEMEDGALDAAAVAFRYQYDLITAEETERWLELRALTLADFSDYFARVYWGNNFHPKTSSPTVPLHEASFEMRELLAIELILSGEFDGMAGRLSWRVAAMEGVELPPEEMEDERQRFAERIDTDRAEWLDGLGRDEAWLEENIRMEAAYRQQCAKLVTPEAAEREIGALRLPLTKFEVETIEFESLDAAQEAIWCVRNDGMSMEEVAKEGRYPYQLVELLLENIAEDLQQKFLSLTPGSLLDPIARDDSFQLARLLVKTEPKADEPLVRERIEQRILERHFADLTAKCIRWQLIAVEPDPE